MYIFGYYDGNTGRETAFDTLQEALDAMEDMWNHLSVNDRKRYLGHKDGQYFCVFKGTPDCDDWISICDILDEIDEDDFDDLRRDISLDAAAWEGN